MFNSKDAENLGEGSFIPKTIQPGDIKAKVLDISLEVPAYDANVYNLVLTLETEPIEDEKFEGFFIDKDVPEMGRHQGQTGKVNASPFSFGDFTAKDGTVLTKGQSLFRWISFFAKELGVSEKMAEAGVSGETIEDYLENAKPYLISPTRYIHFCIAGSEYENKQGYMQYRLFLPKPEKGKTVYAVEPSAKLTVFNPLVHIRKKKAAEPVNSFEGKDSKNDLSLD